MEDWGKSRETGRDGKRRREIRGETGGDTETLEKSQSDREKRQEMGERYLER